MINAKAEFLEATKDYKVFCARLVYREGSYRDYKYKVYDLKQDYTKQDLDVFLNNIDFEYDNSWGTVYLGGQILCTNGYFFLRHFYDGSEEWWLYRSPAPDDIFNKNDFSFYFD